MGVAGFQRAPQNSHGEGEEEVFVVLPCLETLSKQGQADPKFWALVGLKRCWCVYTKQFRAQAAIGFRV